MADPNVTNGTHEPETPKPAHASLSLTEYSANPSPKTSTTPKEKIKSAGVPEDFLLPNGYPDYLRLILTAKVYDVIETTPLTPAVNLSNRLESNVLLKREDLLPVFSFKLRGAYNKMAHLSEAERWKGVIACSAGNHAQGVAFSARKLRIPATITMPTGTPAIKHMNVSRMGGNVVLHGGDFDAAKAECGRLSAMHGLTNIPPFDDPYVIAGQGTIGAEILRQADLSKLEAIFCCVGGGGLIAGTGVYVKRIAPHVKIIGVETFDANALVTSLKAGKRVTLNDVGLFADGAAVKTVGEETFRICSEVVDDVIQVDTDDICAAIKDVFEDTRSILEPAGALSLAGLKKYVERNPSEDTRRQLVAVASGANMNFDRLRFVAERAAIGEKKEALLAVTIPERPGAFARLVAAVNPMNVTEFCYRYSNPGSADVLIGLSVSASTRQHDIKDLIERLEQDGMTARDLSGDELAKSHIRYLVGGRSNADNERLFAFEFPERGGALYKFLTTLQPGFNISLFHYRNYGGDVGKVLAGIQCPPGEEAGLEKFLHDIGYGYKEETDNETYKMFMRPS
ncbi:Threonine dehydratase [Hortaea werneckii]|nr:Threonine dehydratase [Hortaea werneckii]KAI7082048.1 Threonine dehydratase [Hortaea werneckii]KAI7222389.1 Threonine dehydratase [Hortaea werneckii]KAI7242546.1 Threonine dehydratase [Hortaea werneckii]KAI7325212.1 Threonine dehydratase [Hortaea werneckii]